MIPEFLDELKRVTAKEVVMPKSQIELPDDTEDEGEDPANESKDNNEEILTKNNNKPVEPEDEMEYEEDNVKVTRKELRESVAKVLGALYEVHDTWNKKMEKMRQGVNTTVDEHCDKHMPDLEEPHVRAILSVAGLGPQFAGKCKKSRKALEASDLQLAKSIKIELK